MLVERGIKDRFNRAFFATFASDGSVDHTVLFDNFVPINVRVRSIKVCCGSQDVSNLWGIGVFYVARDEEEVPDLSIPDPIQPLWTHFSRPSDSIWQFTGECAYSRDIEFFYREWEGDGTVIRLREGDTIVLNTISDIGGGGWCKGIIELEAVEGF